MSDGQEQEGGALVPQSTCGLISKSRHLVHRGLNDLEKNESDIAWARVLAEAKEFWVEASLEINGIGMEFMLLPAGSFVMGSDLEENEKPIHEVTISKRLYMGRHPVTQSQWHAMMRSNPSRFLHENYPVHGVSWNDAQEFIERLNLLEAKEPHITHFEGSTYEMPFEYRLPTEAEWEYACRADTTGDYAGSLDSMAWYVNNSGNQYLDAGMLWNTDRKNYHSLISSNANQPHEVGLKEANAFGLYDMHGNVFEFCQDFYENSYYLNGGRIDPQGPASGQTRVLRGGCWADIGINLRSARRIHASPDSRQFFGGFRVVAEVPAD